MSVIRKDRQQVVFGAVVVAFLILLPFYAGEYTVTTFVRIIYFGFLASSVGMLISQAGMVSLTQTAFFGLAGYVIGLLGAERNMPFPWRDLIAIGAVLIMALIFGLIAIRTHKIVFLMITLAFCQICWAFAQQNTSLLHGWAGIRGIRPPTIFGIKAKLNFSFRVNRVKFRETYRREGQYLLRGYLAQQAQATLWEYYTQLTEIEEAFKNLKGDIGIRPIFHQLPHRIEAHIFIAFVTYCLHVTLRRRLRDLAPGLTPRAVLEKFSAMQMIDVHLPTSDGRTIILSRYTQPEADLQLLLKQLKLELPDQPPPKITASGQLAK